MIRVSEELNKLWMDTICMRLERVEKTQEEIIETQKNTVKNLDKLINNKWKKITDIIQVLVLLGIAVLGIVFGV